MAAYKKKLKDLGPTSCFLTKADSCLFPISAKHGRHWVKLQYTGTAINVTGFLPSLRLPSLQNAKEWACSLDFTRAMSQAQRCNSSFVICSNISAALSSFSGMAVPSTGDGRCKILSSDITDSTCIVFRHMHPNLTLTNSFGQTQNALCPTVCPKTSKNSTGNLESQFAACSILKQNCGHASMRLNCHGHIDEVPLFI